MGAAPINLFNCSHVNGSTTYTSLYWVAIKSVCINADLSSISLSFFAVLSRFGGMSNFITDKMLLETVHYGRVEIISPGGGGTSL